MNIKTSFPYFLWKVWKHLSLPTPTPVQADIASYIQDTSLNRKIVEAFRGVGKSYISSAYVCWRLLNNPELKVMVVSASSSRANEFSIFTKRLIGEMPELACLRGGLRDSNIAFDVGGIKASHSPSVKSIGITGQLTGSRADLIIADDIEVISNSLTEDQREKLIHRCGEFESIIKPSEEATILYLGTPQTYESIYNKLQGYTTRIWTGRVPEDPSVYEGKLAPYIETLGLPPGSPVDPKRFDDEELMKREANMGRSVFQLQFMLNTSLSDSDRFPLKLNDLIVMPLDTEEAPSKLKWGGEELKGLPLLGLTGDRYRKPLYIDSTWYPYEGSLLAIDPSGRGNDSTGYAVVNMLHGKLYVLEVGGLTGGYSDKALMDLCGIAKANKVKHILIEDNFGNGMFTKLLSPFMAKIHPCTIEEVTSRTQKELRIIDTLEPLLNGHKLVINIDTLKNQQGLNTLGYQLTHITRDRGSLKHDDIVDVLALGCSWWVDQLGVDEDFAKDQTDSRFLREQMMKSQVFLSTGRVPIGNSFRSSWL
jgi:hypothetical protein